MSKDWWNENLEGERLTPFRIYEYKELKPSEDEKKPKLVYYKRTEDLHSAEAIVLDLSGPFGIRICLSQLYISSDKKFSFPADKKIFAAIDEVYPYTGEKK